MDRDTGDFGGKSAVWVVYVYHTLQSGDRREVAREQYHSRRQAHIAAHSHEREDGTEVEVQRVAGDDRTVQK